MTKTKDYLSPDIEVITIKSGQMFCTSDFSSSPDKNYGWEWDDDNY